jgi:hypothetical protein
MRNTFDRRIVSGPVLDFVRACQTRVPCHLGGGAALAGVYLGHRMTGDVDLFSHDADDMRALAGSLSGAAAQAGVSVTVLRDVGHLVRARLELPGGNPVEIDVVHEPIADLAPPPPPIEGVVVESLPDLRASKLTCILSRSEPRDLVDLFFLEQAGYPPDQDLEIALRKDAGIEMLAPLNGDQLQEFRDALATRLRHRALGSDFGER